MSFVLWTRVCPGNHVLGKARIPWEGGNLWVSFGSQWTKVYRYSSPQCNIAKRLRELTCHMELRSVTCHPLFGWQVTGGCQIPLFRRWQQRCGLLLSVLQRLSNNTGKHIVCSYVCVRGITKRRQATGAEDHTQREQVPRCRQAWDQRAAATARSRLARRQVRLTPYSVECSRDLYYFSSPGSAIGRLCVNSCGNFRMKWLLTWIRGVAFYLEQVP